MKKRMKSRWNLHCQREGGTIPMWQVLSFSGKFDPNFFDNLEDPGPPPDEPTRDQRHWTSPALKARNRLRQGMNAAWQRQGILDGRTPKPAPLTRHQQQLLVGYDDGFVRAWSAAPGSHGRLNWQLTGAHRGGVRGGAKARRVQGPQ